MQSLNTKDSGYGSQTNERKTEPGILMNTKKDRFSEKFTIVPMLLTGKSISAEARRALRENRLKDAADMIMKDYGLNWDEASQLLDILRVTTNNLFEGNGGFRNSTAIGLGRMGMSDFYGPFARLWRSFLRAV